VELTPQHVRRAVVALAVTYFALWACAPLTAAPPPTPMAGERQHEVGLGGGFGGDPTAAPGSTACLLDCAGPDGLLWYRHTFKRLELGAELGAGTTYGVGLGGHMRVYPVATDNVRLGGRIDLGAVYAGAGIPLAVGSGPVWVYTEPWIGANLRSPIRFPLGINLTSEQGVSVTLEGMVGPDAGTGMMVHGFFGLGFQL
jgi:hypothetical protein